MVSTVGLKRVEDFGNCIKLIHFGLADTCSYAILKQPAGTFDNAITNGKHVIDNAIKSAGVMYHLDTLQSFDYLNMEIFKRIHDNSAAYNRYLTEIRGNFSDNEMAETANALVVYDGNLITKMIFRYHTWVKRIFCHLCIKKFAKIICNTENFRSFLELAKNFVLSNHSEIL